MPLRLPLILTTFIILSNLSITYAQPCATDDLHQKTLQTHPELQAKWQQAEQNYLTAMSTPQPKAASTYTIPVVVHIIHNNGSENISDAQVIQGIEHMNQAFENIAPYDPTTGVDMDIEFCLAERDPDGNATTGINRVVSPLTQFNYNNDDVTIKDLSRWNPLEYINIWLVRDICSNNGCSVAGYAYFPAVHGTPMDGLVVEADVVGNSPGGSAVLAHEMGHYLGLYHTFQNGCTNNDCLSNGDRVCDTPPDGSTAAVPCDFVANTCSTDTDSGFSTDQNDMFWNYMDYGDWDCYSAFTTGQRERAQFYLTGTRASLLTSQGCMDPCPNPITTNFTTNNTTVNIGETVNFTNNTTGATSFDWLIDGVSFSNTTNSNYTFNALGTYTITLLTSNGDSNCDASFELEIKVVCPVSSDFTPSNYYPIPGENVTFNNVSQNATSYNWTIDGVDFSNNTNITTSFTEGIHTICLIVDNGLCEENQCATVWVFPDEDNEPLPCDDTYIKNFGSDDDDRGTILIDIPDGFIVGGEKGDSTLIVRLDINGNIVWSRTFDFTSQSEAPSDALIDSDGNLVVVGWGGGSVRTNYVFKYNYETDNVIWTRLFSNPSNSAFREVLEKNANGNYFILGQSGTNSAPGQGCDALFLEINRDTGAKITEKNFNTGACEAFNNAIILNNSIYIMGIYSIGNNFGSIRPGLTQLSFSGNIIWSRYYLASPNTSARLYGADLVVENNAIFGVGRGDLNGTSPTNISNYLFKTDLNGSAEWAVNYNLTSGNNERITDMVSVPDGFVIKGYYDAGTTNSFLLKVNKQGDIQWAKSYANSFNVDYNPDLVIKNNYIYTTGGTDGDVLMTKFNAENGELDDPCAALTDLNFTQNTITPFGSLITPNEFTLPITLSSANISPTNTQLNDGEICSTPCVEVCDNGVDDDDDGLIDCLDDECPDCESDCEESTFLRTFGSDDIEQTMELIDLPDGSFIIGGSKADSTILLRLNANGDLISSTTFKFTTHNKETIKGCIIDSDGNLVGAGIALTGGANATNFAFKYDLADNLIWSNTFSTSNPSIYFDILEKSAGDNYFIVGDLTSSGCDAMLLEINRNTGAKVAEYGYNLGSCESFRKAVIYNNQLYLTGRFTEGSSFNKMRPSISSIDFSGNLDWSRTYLVNPNGSARVYTSDILIENNSIYALSRGDLNGTDVVDVTFHLYKTDINGNIEWAKNYDFNTGNRERSNILISVPDGFLIGGYYLLDGGAPASFLMKTDKQGNIQWSKSYDFTLFVDNTSNSAGSIVVKENAIYMSAHLNDDIIFAKLDLNGNLEDTCLYANDIQVTEITINNPYDGQANINQFDTGITLNNVNATAVDSPLQTEVLCNTPCEVCNNGVDDDEDGLIDCLDDDCPDCVPDCEESTFLRTFGSDGIEDASALIELPDGGFIIGGNKANNILLIHANDDGTILWSRTLNFTDFNNEELNHLMLDSDGNLVGTGLSSTSGNNRVNFTFKYNYLSDNVLWANLLESPSLSRFYNLLERTSGGSYFAIGQTATNNSPGLGCDAVVIEFNRNTGAKIAEYNYNLGSCETFQRATIHNNNLYVTGRYNNAGGGTSEMRTSISQIDFSGNEIWSRLYLNNTNVGARTYSGGILVENDAIYVTSHGDLSGTSTTDITCHLYKTDLAGNIEWARNYNFQSGNKENPSDILSMPDGFLVSGNYDDNIRRAFLIKTDKQGNIQWSKTYDFELGINSDGVIFKNGYIYIAGEQNDDIVWAKLDLNGNFIAPCESVEDINISQNDITNPYDGTRNLSEFNLNLNFSNINPSTANTTLEEEDICDITCPEICDNNLDDDGDGLVDCQDPDCECIEICDNGIDDDQDGLTDCQDPDCACTDTCLPDVLPLELGTDITVCENGVHTFDAGEGHDQYIWQDGSTEQTLTAYEEGVYSVTVIDSCDITQTDSVRLFIEPISEINFDDVELCQGDSIALTVGSFFDSYTWLPNQGLSCNDCPTVTISPTQTTEYQVIATSQLGCITVDTFLVEIIDCCPIDLTVDILNQPSCGEICDGSASVSPLAGTPPFTYLWSNGATNSIAADLCVDTYSVTVTDADNCTATTSLQLSDVGNINADIFTENALCFGDENGIIIVENIVGGTPPYLHSLDNEVYHPDSIFFGLAAGAYSLYIQDAAGCVSIFGTVITQPNELFVDLGADVTINVLDSIELFAQTNTIDSLSYTWSPSDGLSCNDCPNPIVSILDTMTYSVIIINADGCQAYDDITINVDKGINVFIPNAFTPNADGVNDTFIIHGGGGVTGVLVLDIYDRWGELVFENANFPVNDHSEGWDGTFKGKQMNPAVFVYYTEVEFLDGTTTVYKGEFTLLR